MKHSYMIQHNCHYLQWIIRKICVTGESLDDEYGQEVPVRKPGEKVTGPPILPPHLLQVILNKDIPAHVCIQQYALGLGYLKHMHTQCLKSVIFHFSLVKH